MFTGADALTWNELNSCESRKTAQTFHTSILSAGAGGVDVSEKMSGYFPSKVKISSPRAF